MEITEMTMHEQRLIVHGVRLLVTKLETTMLDLHFHQGDPRYKAAASNLSVAGPLLARLEKEVPMQAPEPDADNRVGQLLAPSCRKEGQS